LALASVVATVLLTPLAIVEGGADVLDVRILLLGAAVGVLSSVVPYSCELVALRSIRPSVFSILMSLEPAAAALAGMVVLGEFLTWEQWLAMTLVVIASVGATRSTRTLAPAPD
ncbi:DMT family transporter, partial [Nocardioides hankookensis]